MMFEHWLRKEQIIVKKLFEKEYPKEAKMDAVEFVVAGAEEAVRIVKAWSQEHPRKTRQDVFLEMFPTAKLDNYYGSVDVCPADVDAKQRDPDGQGCGDWRKDCAVCRRKFWMQEVE